LILSSKKYGEGMISDTRAKQIPFYDFFSSGLGKQLRLLFSIGKANLRCVETQK